jgi:hypothetical protein
MFELVIDTIAGPVYVRSASKIAALDVCDCFFDRSHLRKDLPKAYLTVKGACKYLGMMEYDPNFILLIESGKIKPILKKNSRHADAVFDLEELVKVKRGIV